MTKRDLFEAVNISLSSVIFPAMCIMGAALIANGTKIRSNINFSTRFGTILKK